MWVDGCHTPGIYCHADIFALACCLCCSTEPLLPASDDAPSDDTPTKAAAAVKAYLKAANTHPSLAPPALHHTRPLRRAAAMRPADNQPRRRLLALKPFNPGEAGVLLVQHRSWVMQQE
jgi:hypothetical protein